MKRGAEIELTVSGLSSKGFGVARREGRVVFVEGAIPGEKVRARVLGKRKGHLRARKLELISPSRHEVAPECPHFGTCGGCSWQNLDYRVQLREKESLIRENLRKIAGQKEPPVAPAAPSPRLYGYRNKMEFTFSPQRWVLESEPEGVDRLFGLGLHPRGRFNKVLEITDCRIAPPEFSFILNETRALARATGLAPYDTRAHTGFFRFLVLRKAEATGEVMAVLITAPARGVGRALEIIARGLKERVPELFTFVHGVSSLKAQVARWEAQEILFGPGFITERVGGFDYRVSPGSFFQTNTPGMEELLGKVKEALGGRRFSLAFDLYCGTGSFSLPLSRYAQRVLGFELMEDAVKDARRNAQENSVKNVDFHALDLDTFFTDPDTIIESYGRPGLVLTDPPRAGMHPKVVKGIAGLGPEVIVYISCNPATMARDIGVLLEQYRLDMVLPADLFPHTPHVEALALLSARPERNVR